MQMRLPYILAKILPVVPLNKVIVILFARSCRFVDVEGSKSNS